MSINSRHIRLRSRTLVDGVFLMLAIALVAAVSFGVVHFHQSDRGALIAAASVLATAPAVQACYSIAISASSPRLILGAPQLLARRVACRYKK